MEKAVTQGKVRSVGLSNFESERLKEVLTAANIKPAVLQVECHPYYQQTALKERIAPYGTKIECWYPLGHADAGLLNEPLFAQLGQKYGKSNAQIILRPQNLRWKMEAKYQISRYVFRFLDLGEAATERTVHLLAPYWGLVLMSFHAGMHGNRIMGVLRKITTTQQTSKIRIWSLRMIIVLLAIGGLYAFIKNKIGSYLFLRTQFVFI